MADLKRPRRYYLSKRLLARLREEEESVWIFKQTNEPGVALPSTFPFLTELNAAGYLAVEDLDGADTNELITYVPLSNDGAAVVLAALAPLI